MFPKRANAAAITGLPRLTEEGELVPTPLPDPYKVNKQMQAERLKALGLKAGGGVLPKRRNALAPPPLKRQQAGAGDDYLPTRPALTRTMSQAADETSDYVDMTQPEEVTLEEGDDVQEEDIVAGQGAATLPPPSVRRKRALPKKTDPATVKKPRKTEDKVKLADLEAHEGFSGLRGWEPVGSVQDLIDALNSGELNGESWLQYTRDRSTYIPSPTYKKLQEEAQEKGVELETLLEEEKKKILDLGRKKTLCRASLSDIEGELKVSSIPPSGDRASAAYPQQLRSWVLSTLTDGNIKFYKRMDRLGKLSEKSE